jgi:hypothetical protein
MSKDYISPEHAIKKIMAESYNKHMVKNNQTSYNLFEDDQDPENELENWWQSLKKEVGDSYNDPNVRDAIAKALKGGRDNLPDLINDIKNNIIRSARIKDLGTSKEPVTNTSTSQPVKTEKPEVKVGYGDGKVDPRLASAAGIGPKLAGSEPPAKPSSETPSSTSTSSSVPASAVRPKPAMPDKPRVPNIKLASKLSDLNYTKGMGAAAKNEYLQKSADAAWAKPTRENQSLRQRAQRQEYGPNR